MIEASKTLSCVLVVLFLASGGSKGSDGGVALAQDSELVHVGTIAPPEAGFGFINTVVGGQDGRIYVADAMAREVLIFDSLGSPVGRVGGDGAGPGEFRQLTSIGITDGVLVGLDARLRRLTLWAPNGGVISRQWPSALGYPASLLGNGEVLYAVGHIMRGPPTRVDETTMRFPQPEVKYARILPDGSILPHAFAFDTVTEARGFQCTGGRRLIGLPPLFPTGPLRAFLGDDRMVVASTEQVRVDIVDPLGGVTLDTFVSDAPLVRVTDEIWEEATVGFRAAQESAGPFEDCRLGDLRPSTRPPVRSIVSDRTGRIWVEAASGDGHELVILDANGTPITTLPFPRRDSRVAPYANGQLVYLVAVDHLDVQSVHVYRLTPTTSARPPEPDRV